jgi:putative sugar O-methyltransferase
MSTTTSPLAARLRRANPTLIRQWAKRRLQATIARSGYLVTRLDQESRHYLEPSHNGEVPLPPGAAEELRNDNPRLAELQTAYDALDYPSAVPSQWRDAFLKSNLSLAWFRGDNAYVWQLRLYRGSAKARNYLSLLDVQSRDKLGLLDKVKEDGVFGAWTFVFGDRPAVSRDLLDSVNEINYLDDQIGLGSLDAPTVLDIGAGYGRLAHRMSEGLPNLARYDCIDGVAVSTFLCEYYLRFRGVPDTVHVVPLNEVDTLADTYTVAVNVHSFSECTRAAIQWWLERIAERDIEWLLIVPNTQGQLLSTEIGGSHLDFMPDVVNAGFELADHRPVYQSEELRELIDLHDEFFLFRRSQPSS